MVQDVSDQSLAPMLRQACDSEADKHATTKGQAALGTRRDSRGGLGPFWNQRMWCPRLYSVIATPLIATEITTNRANLRKSMAEAISNRRPEMIRDELRSVVSQIVGLALERKVAPSVTDV